MTRAPPPPWQRQHCGRGQRTQPPLTSQLRRLALVNCRRLPLAELRHVHSLRGLTALELERSFTAPLDSASQSLLTPPSPILSRLEEFEYRLRARPEDFEYEAPWG